MRISTPYQYNSYLTDIQSSNSEYFRIQQQLASGKRFEKASDDPLATTLSLDSRRLLSRYEQFNSNLKGAKDYLGHAETALSEVSILVQRAYTLSVQGASDTMDSATRGTLANEVKEIMDRLVSLGNMQGAGGQFIFAGHLSDTKPFQGDGTTMTYSGDDQPVLVETRPGEYLRANLDGAEALFGGIYDAFVRLSDNLRTGNVQALSSQSIEELQGKVGEVATTRGQLGNRFRTVEDLTSQNQRRVDDLTAGVSELEDIDFAETYVRYQEAQNAYQAALQVASQGMQLSLMDFIR